MEITRIHKIGVISDTHDLIRPSAAEHLKECEVILHAGDISSRAVLNELQRIAPVYAVRGNADEAWGMDLPKFIDSTVCGIHFYMTHKKKDLPSSLEGYDLIIFGHSHRYEERKEGDVTFLNPGSCGPRRAVQAVTMAVVDVSDKGMTIHRIDLPHLPPSGARGSQCGFEHWNCDPSGSLPHLPPSGARGSQCGFEHWNCDPPGSLPHLPPSGARGSQCGFEHWNCDPSGSLQHTAQEADSIKNQGIDMQALVKRVMKETDKGHSVEMIAEKTGMESSLIEQIVRLYLTHPGVTVDGILGKMGL